MAASEGINKRKRDVVEDVVVDEPKTKKSKKEKKTEDVAVEKSEKKKKKKDKKEKKAAEEAEVPVQADDEAEVDASTKAEKKKKKKDKKNKEEEVSSTKESSSTTTKASSSKSSSESMKWYEENFITIDGMKEGEEVPAPCLAFDSASTGFPEKLSNYLQSKPGFKTPSQIQSTCWPLMMAGKDVFGIAKTGSGKTLGFTMPFLARALNGTFPETKKRANNQPRMVCVAPTKELALQIAEVCEELGSSSVCGGQGFKCASIIGGVSKGLQRQSIRNGVDIVVATSGRLIDVTENDCMLDLSQVDFMVLDEADRMLDMGFIGDMRKLAGLCSKPSRQTMLFSATWPASVRKLALELITRPKEVVTVTVGRRKVEQDEDGNPVDTDDIVTEDKLQLNDSIKQEVVVMDNDRGKWDLLVQTLNKNAGKKIIIFGLYKKEVARLESWLLQTGFKIVALQGDMTQTARTAAITDFKSGKIKMLIATDVAGRGLDIPDVEVVINYTMPLTMEDFVHRCGRTGRAGKKGNAVSFFNSAGEHNEVEKVFPLIRLLEGAKQAVPEKLRALDKNTFTATKKKAHSVYGNFFKSEEEMAELEKKRVTLVFSDSDDE